MPDPVQLLTGGSIVLLLAGIIGYLLQANWKDRTQQQDVLTGLRNQIKEQGQDYEERLGKVEARHTQKIDRLELRIDELEREIEEERNKRLAADTRAAAAEIRAAQAEYKFSILEASMNKGSGS
jgi:hypothetical protein